MIETKEISIVLIDDPAQPMRTDLDMEGIAQLAKSIREQGLISPITVRPRGDRFEVVAGHRRITACRLAALSSVRCVVRDLTDEEATAIMATENIERLDTDPVEEALLIARYVGEDDGKIGEIAKRLNRTENWVHQRLEILAYPDYMIAAIKQGTLKLGVASWLGAIEDETYRKMFVESAIAHGMTGLQAQICYNQWKGGVLAPAETIMPGDIEAPEYVAPKAHALCRKCDRLAESPNLQSVFIHVDCPPEPEVAAS